MRLITIFALCTTLLTACATTGTTDETVVAESKKPQREISSLTFISGGPAVPAQLRRDQTLRIDSDLSTKMEIKNGYNKVLSEKSGKITQEQFDAMTAKLNSANYIYLKPKPGAIPKPGSGKRTLVVSSDLGAHRFSSIGSTGFPDEIAEIFAMKDQLLPE